MIWSCWLNTRSSAPESRGGRGGAGCGSGSPARQSVPRGAHGRGAGARRSAAARRGGRQRVDRRHSSSSSRKETLTPKSLLNAPLAWVRNSESRPSSRKLDGSGSSPAARDPRELREQLLQANEPARARRSPGRRRVDATTGGAAASGPLGFDASGRAPAVAWRREFAAGSTQKRRRSNGYVGRDNHARSDACGGAAQSIGTPASQTPARRPSEQALPRSRPAGSPHRREAARCGASRAPGVASRAPRGLAGAHLEQQPIRARRGARESRPENRTGSRSWRTQ